MQLQSSEAVSYSMMSWPYRPATENDLKSASGICSCFTTCASGHTRFRAFSNSFVAVLGSGSVARQAGLYIYTAQSVSDWLLPFAEADKLLYLAQASCTNTVRVDGPGTSTDTSVGQKTTIYQQPMLSLFVIEGCTHDPRTKTAQQSEFQSMPKSVLDLSLSRPYCMVLASS